MWDGTQHPSLELSTAVGSQSGASSRNSRHAETEKDDEALKDCGMTGSGDTEANKTLKAHIKSWKKQN